MRGIITTPVLIEAQREQNKMVGKRAEALIVEIPFCRTGADSIHCVSLLSRLYNIAHLRPEVKCVRRRGRRLVRTAEHPVCNAFAANNAEFTESQCSKCP